MVNLSVVEKQLNKNWTKSVFFKSWYEKGIRCINDLIDDKGKLLTREQCEQKFCLKLNYLSYCSVTQAIKCRYQMHIEKCEKNVVDPLMPSHIKILVHEIKCCPYIYKTFLRKTNCVYSIFFFFFFFFFHFHNNVLL